MILLVYVSIAFGVIINYPDRQLTLVMYIHCYVVVFAFCLLFASPLLFIAVSPILSRTFLFGDSRPYSSTANPLSLTFFILPFVPGKKKKSS